LGRKSLVALLVVGILAIAALAGVRYMPSVVKEFSGDDLQTSQSSTLPGADYRVVTAGIGTDQFALWVADTVGKQQLGLGKRQSLPAKQGMIFPYDVDDKQCFWMKDMNFSIDMIWVDAEKRVVHIQPKVSPDTYPQTFCTPTPSRYVVELAPGSVERIRLKVGDPMTFSL
jgi:uncharacterized protein